MELFIAVYIIDRKINRMVTVETSFIMGTLDSV